jgi:hypothetical protein
MRASRMPAMVATETVQKQSAFNKFFFGESGNKKTGNIVPVEPKFVPMSVNAKFVPTAKNQTYVQFIEEQEKIKDQIDTVYRECKMPLTPLFCTPNCKHNHGSVLYQNDFSKTFEDPIMERPGICFLKDLKNAPEA